MNDKTVGVKFKNINGSVFLCFKDNGEYVYVSHRIKQGIVYFDTLTKAIEFLR